MFMQFSQVTLCKQLALHSFGYVMDTQSKMHGRMQAKLGDSSVRANKFVTYKQHLNMARMRMRMKNNAKFEDGHNMKMQIAVQCECEV